MKIKELLGVLVLCAALSIQARAQSFPTNGLVAYYPLNGSPTNGYGSGGSINGSVSLTKNFLGASNAALHFAGNAYIAVTPTPINVNTNWTISFWCAMDNGVTGANNFLSTGQDQAGCLNVRWGGSPPTPWQLIAGWYGNGTNPACMGSSTNSPYNWNFVTCLKNGLTNELFINNVLIASGVAAGTVVDTGSMWLGRHQNFASYYLQGSMSDFFFYDRALSSQEVQQLYQYEVSPGPPAIFVQPNSLTVIGHSNASFTVAANGLEPLSYQWQFEGTNITGATLNTLVVTNVSPTNLGTYDVIVSNSLGSLTSTNATLSMYPYIQTAFTGGVAYLGGSDTLSIQAWGSGPLTYQWYSNGTAISNATNQTYTLSDVQLANSGLYSVVVTSPLGSVTNTPEQVVVEVAGTSLGLYPGLTITGVVGNSYIIQSSASLSDPSTWSNVGTITLELQTELWVDINGNTVSNKQKFYRVLPAP